MGIQSGSEEILRDDFNRPVDAAARPSRPRRLIVDVRRRRLLRPDHQGAVREGGALPRDVRLPASTCPSEMKSVGFGGDDHVPELRLHARRSSAKARALTLSDDDYRYYHKLYLLTRTTLPRPVVQAIGRSRAVAPLPAAARPPCCRRSCPFFFLRTTRTISAREILDIAARDRRHPRRRARPRTAERRRPGLIAACRDPGCRSCGLPPGRSSLLRCGGTRVWRATVHAS